ncbi:DUF5327 family protein [Ureibacillus endophyticus]|uniref:Uracil-DNA glycosylase n=1 Tax=Ureibacillus endophyticus TaxID=1978490 RepID=A0A494YW05_9BACL|nr:DUF5327 family protein [Lysinibacillus endophyticus]RKQ14337.1 uracil-DNA glycosylase [Lysinibacillus endophyticus]
MMISYKALLNEIELLLANVKNTEDEQQIREQLSAIRALCNVGLASNQNSKTQTKSSSAQSQQNQQNQSNSSSSQTQNIINSVSSLNASKLKEEDANGDSIFDF